MRRIINDDIQLIKLNNNAVLTPSMIHQALYRAHSNYMYAKFIVDNLYIQVNFARDETISVSSNIRNQSFLRDVSYYSRVGWNIGNLKSFLYQWLQISRRLLW